MVLPSIAIKFDCRFQKFQFFLINNFFHILILKSFLSACFYQRFMIITFSNFFLIFVFANVLPFGFSGILQLFVLIENHSRKFTCLNFFYSIRNIFLQNLQNNLQTVTINVINKLILNFNKKISRSSD